MDHLQKKAGKETISRYDIPKINTSGVIKRTVTELWAFKSFKSPSEEEEGGKEEGVICQVWLKQKVSA